MLRKRLITSFILVLVGLGCVTLLPKSFGLKDAAVFEAFPAGVGEWQGEFRKPGDREQNVLDEATDFRKRFYYRESPQHPRLVDSIDATMVLSGDDMNNSIHRPERCLVAQGYQDIRPSTVDIDVGAERDLRVTRLHFVHRTQDGSEIPAIMYYWFVGADHITNSHYERTLYDITHRLLEGTNQRWAYISLLSYYGENLNPRVAPNTEPETDALMQDFIRRTFFQIHKTDLIKGWEHVKQG